MFETWMLRYSILKKFSRDTGTPKHGVDLLGNVASRARIGLDPCTILTVQHFAVLEQDIRNIVVALATNGPDRETVAAITIHVFNCDIVTTGNGDTVVLIQHS